MSEENTRKVDEAIEALENAPTEELEDKLDGVSGGAERDAVLGDTICEIDTLCKDIGVVTKG